MEISNSLVDLGAFPIWDIPAHLESAQDVWTMVNLNLECLQEEHASSAGPWVKNLVRLALLHPQAICLPPFFLLACM
jgi:hypothetical protein